MCNHVPIQLSERCLTTNYKFYSVCGFNQNYMYEFVWNYILEIYQTQGSFRCSQTMTMNPQHTCQLDLRHNDSLHLLGLIHTVAVI